SIGSNSWAVSGDRSVTGKPILANDPHLSLENPSILYENHLAGGGFNVYGFSIPGLPGVIIGHNENIAWGLTSLMADDLDLFVESFNYKYATEYRSGNSYKHVEIIEETIPIRKETPVRMRILQTHHGPIVSHMISEDGLTDVSISLCWAGHEVSDEGLAYYLINKAENWTAFREALSHYGTSPQNFIYADRQGNIGIQAAGKIPIRSGKTGFSLRKGEDPENDWKGFIPFDELPHLKNPPCGFVASANHRITNLSGNYSISGYWAGSSRIDRIRYKLSEKDSFSVSDFKKMQADVNSIYAKNILALINPQLENMILKTPMEKKIHTLLNKWDGAMKAGSAEAAFFEVFSGKLLANLFQDEMGNSLFTSFLKLHSLSLAS
ncbi:penicillin acylase family protein, partial [bacterium]|nr:penicillin acylase family protein [bacterium]